MRINPIEMGAGIGAAVLPSPLEGLFNRRTETPLFVPGVFRTMEDRFDPTVIDLPSGSARVRLVCGDAELDAVLESGSMALVEPDGSVWDAELIADENTWQEIADDFHSGTRAFHEDRLRVRRNLHLAIGFLAATSGIMDSTRLEFSSVSTSAGNLSVISAGQGDPLICLHGLGATKATFMTTISAFAPERRVIAIDLPGFGDSDKPLSAAYDAPYFAGAVIEAMDELGIETADLAGNSMGGRVAIEVALQAPERVSSLVLLAPALAWLRNRHFRFFVPGQLSKLGLLPTIPRAVIEPLVRSLVPGGRDTWAASGVDEFLRSFLTPRGRVAFFESARNVYLDEPHGEDGLWERLSGLEPGTLFVWGRQDRLVPIGFRRHVERALESAEHLEFDCGHVPHLELPEESHRHIRLFLDSPG